MQYTPNDFFAKWFDRFRPGNVLVEKTDFQEFVLDLKDTFGVEAVSVPPYVAGTTYAVGNLVRYTPTLGQEGFYYALNPGKLTAPGPSNTTDWKVVPGPVLPTALSQQLTLAQAQGLENNGVVAGREYLIDFGPDAQGATQTITVRGVSNECFDVLGTLEVNGVRTAVTNVNVGAGTWQVVGGDTYTKAQTDTLLATKAGAVVQQVYQGWPFNSTTLNLTASSFNKYLRLDAQANSTVNLPTPTVADVGKTLVLWHYGRAANLTVLVQARYTNGVKPLDASFTPVVPGLAFNYVAELKVLLLSRGTPYNDTVPGYAVTALSLLEVQPTVTPAQLADVATTLPLTPTRTAAYTLQLSDAGCLVPVASSSALTVTVPDHVAVPFPVGTTLYVAQDGTGQLTLAPAPGVAVQTADGYKTAGQWQEVALHKRDLNTWVLKGGVQ